MKKPLRHILDYILLISVLSIVLFLLIYFNGNPKIQKVLVLLSGCSYVAWGYLHHKKEKTLDLSIILEYLLYAVLGTLLLRGLL